MHLMGVSSHNYIDGGWETEGLKIAPGVDVTLAQTPALDAGIYDIVLYLATASGAGIGYFRFTHYIIDPPGSKTTELISTAYTPWPAMIAGYKLGQGDYLRIYSIHAASPTAQGNIWWVRRV